MTITGIFLRIIRRISFIRRFFQAIVRRRMAGERSRPGLNRRYNRFNYDEKAVFQNLFSKIFRHGKNEISDGTWVINFRGRPIQLPLRNRKMWLDWDNAISILGHDPDIKITYENLLDNDPSPKVFFDIGANYGTHSLLFLSQGIKTITFEPNPTLKEEFDEFCRLNNLHGVMENCAVGDRTGIAGLWFTKHDTWLGTIVNSTAELIKKSHELERIEVPLITIDEYAERNRISPDLMKIDTEGSELNVLNGAKRVIESGRPLIIFESNKLGDRQKIWNIFQSYQYNIYKLPYTPGSKDILQSVEQLLESASFNFIAVPQQYPATRR